MKWVFYMGGGLALLIGIDQTLSSRFVTHQTVGILIALLGLASIAVGVLIERRK